MDPGDLEMMGQSLLLAAAIVAASSAQLQDQSRTIHVDGRQRSCLLHVPPAYSPDEPAPVVLVLHGAGTNAAIMVPFCGMNQQADAAGFIAVYPDGTGTGIFQTFNAGGRHDAAAADKPDDVRFISALLDHLRNEFNIDQRRIYATGMSNGGMMCYRLASELSDRIAAIAPVSGTMAIDQATPTRPVPIMHFHGTDDRIVPPGGPDRSTPTAIHFKSIEETIQHWVQLNGCRQSPVVTLLENRVADETSVTQTTYSSCRNDSEVIYVEISGGGHTWPGQQPPLSFLGRSTKDISANEMMWEFFQRHHLP
jgi:polyhydroxybutyrate depolymerase